MNRPAAFPVLLTPRLELRATTHADVTDLFTIFSDPAVMKYWSTPPMASDAEAEIMVDRSHGFFDAGAGIRWAVVRLEDRRVIGTVSLFHFDDQNSRAEIGYALGREAWGRGFMREALQHVIEYAFGPMDLRRLEADTDPRNAPSIGLLERLGFAREGLLRERWVVAGEVSDSMLLGLLRSEWRERQGSR